MIVQVQNKSAFFSREWVRCTIRTSDVPQGMTAWRIGDTRFALGRSIGMDLFALDVKAALDPGQRLSFDLTQAVVETPAAVQLPPEAVRDPVGYFGVPMLMGTPLAFLEVKQDGAALATLFGGRLAEAPQLYCTLRVLYRPDETEWRGTIRVTASDVSGQQPVVSLPDDLVFRMGAGNATLEHAGETFGAGQSRVYPVTLSRTSIDLLANSIDPQQFAVGIDRLGPLAQFGPTTYPQGRFDVARWILAQTPAVKSCLSSWENSNTIGIPKDSTQTGDEEDQGAGYQDVELFYAGGLPSIYTNWLCAITQWPKRPYHHLERDGKPLSLTSHPRLVLWQSLPHYSTSVSPERLGLPRLPTKAEMHGWFGPDDEHMLINRLAGAYELTGCPEIQHELDMLARCLLYSYTLDPRLSTSGPRAARARGYLGILVAQLWRLLEDRTLADRVKDRWTAILRQVYMVHDSDPAKLWDVRQSYTTDANGVKHPTTAALGSISLDDWPNYCMTYQLALGVYGVWMACKVLGLQDGVDFAARQAAVCMHASYSPSENPSRVWDEFECVGVDAAGRFATAANGRNTTGMFRVKWLPLCLVPVLFDGDQQSKLQAGYIRDKLLAEAMQQTVTGQSYAQQPCDWFPPTPA